MNLEPPSVPPIPKKGLSTGCIVALVLGIVAAIGLIIIGVLVALAVPAANGVIKKANLVRTQAALKDIELAVKNYQIEFNRYPGGEGEIECAGSLLRVLLGFNAEGLNPRQIRFMEPPMARGGKGGLTGTDPAFTLLDVWGQPYRLSMDTDGDGKVSDPEHPGMSLDHSVIVWSAGDDGNPATWVDNIKNW